MLDYCLSHPQAFHALILILAAITTLLTLKRTLPWQNVIMIAVLIVLSSAIVQIIGLKTGFPFGHYFYSRDFGPRILQILPWPVPVIWVVAILNSRGTSRLMLSPLRGHRNFGLYSIALTCLLATLFDFALEPFAFHMNHYWNWRSHPTGPSCYGVPWTNFAGWAIVTLLILIITTPWLIDKKIGQNPPLDYYPLMIWGTLTLLLAIANAANQFRSAAIFTVFTTTIVSFIAVLNSQRKLG